MAEPNFSAEVRANGHEGYEVILNASRLGIDNRVLASFPPEHHPTSIHRFQMAAARRAAHAYRDGFNKSVEIVAEVLAAIGR